MEMEQIVFEYGKLQLNFISMQNQTQQMARALAEANKSKDEVHSIFTKEHNQLQDLLKAILGEENGDGKDFAAIRKLADEINNPPNPNAATAEGLVAAGVPAAPTPISPRAKK